MALLMSTRTTLDSSDMALTSRRQNDGSKLESMALTSRRQNDGSWRVCLALYVFKKKINKLAQ